MSEKEQKERLKLIIQFYEERIEKDIRGRDFDSAISWFYRMMGTCHFAQSIGLIYVTYRKAENDALFQRILDAKYGG